MIRTFIKNSSIYFVANGLTKVIGLLFLAYVARVLTREQMGLWGMLNILVSFLPLLMTLQIQDGFARYYLDFDPAQRPAFEWSVINLLLISNVAVGAVLFFLRPMVQAALDVPITRGIYVILLGLPFAMGVTQLFNNKLCLENRALAAGALGVLQLLVYVGATLFFFQLNIDRVLAIFLGSLTQGLFGVVWCFVDGGGWRFVTDWSLVRRSVVFSALLVPACAGLYLSTLTGKWMLNRELGTESAGIYEAISRVATIIQTALAPLLQATTPIIYAEYRDDAYVPRHRLLLEIHMLAALALAILFSLFSRELVYLVVGPSYVDYSGYIGPLVLASVLLHVGAFFTRSVHLAQRTQYVTLLEVIAGVTNIGLTPLLVRRFGFQGALAAAAATFGLRYVLYLYTGNVLYPRLKSSYRLALGFAFGCGALLALHYLLRGVPLPLRALLCAAEGLLVVALFLRRHRVRPRDLLALLRPV